MSLRPYQLEAITATHERWADDRSTLVVMATGTGKTFTASTIVSDRVAEGRILWLAHREELLEQAAETLRDRVGLESNLEKASSYAPREPELYEHAPVVVASVQTMRGQRLWSWDRDAFATIVVDEAHHTPAKTYRDILAWFEDAKVLGLTATPDRGDEVGLGACFDSVAYEYPILRGIREGYLCDIVQKTVECADLDLSDVRTVAGDLNQGQLEQAMMDGGVLHQIAAPLVEQAGDRQTLVFTAGVEQAHALTDVLANYLSDTGKVAAVDGTTAKEDRAEIVRKYRDGSIQFLLNCQVYTEGFDAPETACIAVARPTKSRALYAQMLGRGTRIAEGKENALVLDFVGNAGRHTLVNPTDVLAGKPLPDPVARDVAGLVAQGKPTAEALAEAEEMARERARRAEERRARAAKVRADVQYQARVVDPFDVLGVSPCDYGPDASPKQLQFLSNLGVDTASRHWGQYEASRMIDKLTKRRKRRLCTYKQAALFQRYGLPTDIPFADASRIIDAISDANQGGKW